MQATSPSARPQEPKGKGTKRSERRNNVVRSRRKSNEAQEKGVKAPSLTPEEQAAAFGLVPMERPQDTSENVDAIDAARQQAEKLGFGRFSPEKSSGARSAISNEELMKIATTCSFDDDHSDCSSSTKSTRTMSSDGIVDDDIEEGVKEEKEENTEFYKNISTKIEASEDKITKKLSPIFERFEEGKTADALKKFIKLKGVKSTVKDVLKDSYITDMIEEIPNPEKALVKTALGAIKMFGRYDTAINLMVGSKPNTDNMTDDEKSAMEQKTKDDADRLIKNITQNFALVMRLKDAMTQGVITQDQYNDSLLPVFIHVAVAATVNEDAWMKRKVLEGLQDEKLQNFIQRTIEKALPLFDL